MKLSGLAVSILVAAAALPWLTAGSALVLAAISLVTAVVNPRGQRTTLLVFPICLLWVFWQGIPGKNDLQNQLRTGPRSVRLRIQIRGDAETMEYPGRKPELRVPVQATARYRAGEWSGVGGRLQLRMSAEQAPALLTGTVWEASGVVSPGRYPYVGLHRADWRFVPDSGSLQPVEGAPMSRLLQSCFRIRERLAQGIRASCPGDPETAAALQALLLGQRSGLDRDTRQQFVKTGLIHIFAVSGLHLGLLSAMLLFVCRWLGVPPRFYPAAVLPLLALFTLYTGLRASALRALIMTACLLLAPAFTRKAHLKSAFLLALILILLLAPTQLYDLGFQYSFLLVGSLLACGRIFSGHLQRWFAPDPWAAPTPGRSFRERHLWPGIQGALVVTMICFLISAPLTAYSFNLFSPIGLVGNLLAVPLVFLLLATGFPALPALLLPETFSRIIFTPARWSAEALLAWVDVMERMPGGFQWVQAPPLWMLLLFYGLLFCWWRWPSRKSWALAALTGLAGYAGTSAWLDTRAPRMGVIDADRGQAAWLQLPGEGIVLVDCGSDWSGYEVARALRSRGIDRIDSLIFTHPDRHHVQGAVHVLETYTPGRILVAGSDLDHDLYSGLDPQPLPLEKGNLVQIAGWTMEVLHPPADSEAGRADDRSLVLRFSRGFSSVLVMGGAGAEVESELLAAGKPLAARLLLAGHPRDGGFNTLPFLLRVRPEAVLFSGRGFTGVSPGREEAEARAREAGLTVLRLTGSRPMRLNLEQGALMIDNANVKPHF